MRQLCIPKKVRMLYFIILVVGIGFDKPSAIPFETNKILILSFTVACIIAEGI